MNVLVTAGGTVEKIDEVRSIVNMSTGRLGSLIADAFASSGCVDRIMYICGKNAARPESGKAEAIPVESVADLENTLRAVLSETRIDIIVHSMAVSDYRVKAVTSTSALAKIMSPSGRGTEYSGNTDAGAELAALLQKRLPDMRSEGKIGSDVDNMLLLMERTPKIISMLKTLSPHSTIVGFKLLHNVPHETLIDRGYQVLTQNACSFVLANDLRDITGDQHIGYLINKDRDTTRFSTKEEIAAGIVSATISERGRRD